MTFEVKEDGYNEYEQDVQSRRQRGLQGDAGAEGVCRCRGALAFGGSPQASNPCTLYTLLLQYWPFSAGQFLAILGPSWADPAALGALAGCAGSSCIGWTRSQVHWWLPDPFQDRFSFRIFGRFGHVPMERGVVELDLG